MVHATSHRTSWNPRGNPRRKDVVRALRLANASTPSLDGILYLAWQRSGELAVDTLWQAFNSLLHEDAATQHYKELNLALLVCLPKNPAAA